MKTTILALTILTITTATAAAQPVPSYNLPPSGHIREMRPNGVTNTWYTNYGQSYFSIGPEGSTHAYQLAPGNTVIWKGPSPRDVQNDIDALRNGDMDRLLGLGGSRDDDREDMGDD